MEKKTKKIYYVAELNLPNTSAYSIHVMKMCEAIKKLGFNPSLITISNHSLYKTLKNYNIDCKFNIISVFKNHIQMNLLMRLIFTFKILIRNFEKESFFISRSINFAMIAAAINKKVILELHHEITGFSKIIYYFLKKLSLIDNLNYIFLHKNLNKIYKIPKDKFIVLDDAVKIESFKNFRSNKYRNTCVYIGSFFKGKGVEQILRLAELDHDIKFHIYGEKKNLNYLKIPKNVKILDHISYSKIPKILSKYNIALMPYQKKVKGKSSLWLERYMSPLKMFDYMAARMIIVASDLAVYKHILKNNYNCQLLKVNDDKNWIKKINLIFKNLKKFNKLRDNAKKTAQKYTWNKRCQRIIHFSKEKYIK